MKRSELRRARCDAAIEGVLDFLGPGTEAQQALRRLSERFQSPGAILESDLAALAADIVDDTEAELLSHIPSLARVVRRAAVEPRALIDTHRAAADCLLPLFIGVPIEQFFLLCLDAGGRQIRCSLLQKGTLDQTPFYLGSVLQCAVTSGAHAVVLCHNHPGGTLRPSQADIRCTLDALNALFALGVILLDHIIVAGQKTVSIREGAYLDQEVWIQQAPEDRLNRNWLRT